MFIVVPNLSLWHRNSNQLRSLKMKTVLRRAVLSIASVSPGLRRLFKERDEIGYWKKRFKDEVTLKNAHYQFFFTDEFGLTLEDYEGKHVLDVGCGPRGSLEWCTLAASTTGADPLVGEYLKLGAQDHRMTYVEADAENLPFDDGQFDIISCFNALDHVESIEGSLTEMHRCLAPGGTMLLIVEVNHPPTLAEPHFISPEWLTEWLSRTFDIVTEKKTGVREDHNIFRSLREGTDFREGEAGVMALRLVKRA